MMNALLKLTIATLVLATTSSCQATSEALAQQEVVLVAQRTTEGEGSRYHWDTFEVFEIIKTVPGFGNNEFIQIAVPFEVNDLPPWKCEIRLVPYNLADPKAGWKLKSWKEPRAKQPEQKR